MYTDRPQTDGTGSSLKLNSVYAVKLKKGSVSPVKTLLFYKYNYKVVL